jgi:hypothetical protein
MNNKNLSYIFMGLILLVLVVIAVLLALILLNNQNSNRNNPTPTPTPTVQVETTTGFSGKYITAEIPNAWKIVEYENGQGSTMLTSGVTYTGLTGIKIFNATNQEVFSVQAVSGIGGRDICSTKIYKFSDTAANYVTTKFNEGHADAQSVIPPAADPQIVDLTGQTYSEFTLFGNRVRRIGDVLYWNTSTNNNASYFNPECAMPGFIITTGKIKFTVTGTVTRNYSVKLTTGTSQEDLVKLDAILKSISY